MRGVISDQYKHQRDARDYHFADSPHPYLGAQARHGMLPTGIGDERSVRLIACRQGATRRVEKVARNPRNEPVFIRLYERIREVLLMKLISIKAASAKIVTLGLLAAAFGVTSPSRAQAQVSLGIQLGGPVYGPTVYHAPAYSYAPEYYPQGYGDNGYGDREAWERHAAHERHEAQERYEAQLRREEHERHEAWERERRYNRGGWNRYEDHEESRGNGYYGR